ncbi:UDP-N-acetylglucosamine 4,6-dehydratase family protein [Woodsholea maritima]|uniref:UDP-N-acetylglucosamine 4,6-dehydratase family protein n=1 Tax=Woodsholea maritima TaxID=240237 RepID=UPI0003767114|nr:nucleoside-diphosphate sugar epimerase/dehydratase [Woodsholea maritima]
MNSVERPNLRQHSLIGVYGYDLLAGFAAMFISIVLRYEFEEIGTPPGTVEWSAAGLFMLVCAAIFPLYGLHKSMWRYTTLSDAMRVLQAACVSHLVFLPIFFLTNRLDDFPRSSLLISGVLLSVLLLVPRLVVYAWRSGDLFNLIRLDNNALQGAVLVGTEESLTEVLRDQRRRPGGPRFRFKALIELSGQYEGRSLMGLPVAGDLSNLETTIQRLSTNETKPLRIVLADNHPDRDLIAECARIAGRCRASLSRARTGDGVAAFTQVEAADLLSRTPRSICHEGARALVQGKRVLVTGAGGAIGGELTRQIARHNPERLILLDAAESHLYEIDMELRRWEAAPYWTPILGDVRDKARLEQVFRDEKPDVVLHAAALKHVPLMEQNSAEAVLTNVGGTMNVIEAAQKHNCQNFVLISTDKAVDPSSVMGATKRVAELYLGAIAARVDSPQLCAVRFGNVLASTGSVVPLFEKQIEAGGPVTVTHPEITRYFMTIQEAASLVLEAGGASARDQIEDGALYLLDMGEPVSIARLARQLIRLRGMEPGKDIAIKVTGLRPGEKLHETLTHAFETVSATKTEGVLRVQGHQPDLEDLEDVIEALLNAAQRRDEGQIRALLDRCLDLGRPQGVISTQPRLSAQR